MRKCTNRHPNPDDALYCSVCGERLRSEAEPSAETPTVLIREGKLEDLVGRTVGESYEIDGFIGRGGMASVWSSSHQVGEGISTPAAVKVLDPEFLKQNPEAMEWFMGEAQIVARVANSHIVPIYRCGKDTKLNTVYIAMKRVDGETVERLLELKREWRESGEPGAEDPLPPLRILDIMSQTLDAMAAVHDLKPKDPIVHRDLSPSNLMVTRTGSEGDHVYVLDFGIARFRDASGGERASFFSTSKDTIMGKYPYMSPEHWNKRFCPGSDIFSLGIVLYEMVTGKKPFGGDGDEDDVTILNNIMHKTLPPPELPADLRGMEVGLRRILEKALAKDPVQRYGSCREFRRDLLALNSEGDAGNGGGTDWGKVIRWGVGVVVGMGASLFAGYYAAAYLVY